jgi:hypothetical protein
MKFCQMVNSPWAFLHNFVKFKDFNASNFPKFELLDVRFVVFLRKWKHEWVDNLECHICNFFGLHTNIKFIAIFQISIVIFLIMDVVIDFNGNHHKNFWWIFFKIMD